MLDLKNVINNALQAERKRELDESDQLLLGEIILKLEAVSNKNLPVIFDYKHYFPTGLSSWRGSYCELAIQYEGRGSFCCDKPLDTCERNDFKEHSFKCPCGGPNEHKYDTTIEDHPTVEHLLEILKLACGKVFTGYKGGDFIMTKNTPVWVSNYGTDEGFQRDKEAHSTYLIDVKEESQRVILITKDKNY